MPDLSHGRLTPFGLLLLSASLLGACGPRAMPASHATESPDLMNSPGLLGLSGPFPWDKVKTPTTYSLPATPWADTYWPTYQKGMANRFQKKTLSSGLRQFSLHAALASFFQAADTGDPLSTYVLSPAEKHDILLAKDARHVGPQNREAILQRASAIDTQLQNTLQTIQATETDYGNRQKRYVAAIKNAARAINAIARDPVMTAALPLTASAWGDWSYSTMRPENKINAETKVSLGSDRVDDSAGDDWSWEGICHGWSPAALYAPKPQHAVLAVKGDGTKVLFNEGDLRGLLSKSWADLAPSDAQTFLGSRCDVSDKKIRVDGYGRSLDAVISCQGDCGGLDGVGISYTKEFLMLGRQVKRFTLFGKLSTERFLAILGPDEGKNKAFKTRLFQNAYDLQQWVAGRAPSLGVETKITLQASCRDMNPMLFHLLLTQIMPRGQGFVMDRVRAEQVWNQPVKSFTLTYEPMDGVEMPAGEPVPVTEVNDLYWQHRAVGTAMLLNVTAIIDWVRETSPHAAYETPAGHNQDDDNIAQTELRYTLEFNDKRQLIGGEWGHVPQLAADPDVESRQGPGPDFAFFYRPGAQPANRYASPQAFPSVNYDGIVQRLHACSLDMSGLGRMADGQGHTLTYKTCPF